MTVDNIFNMDNKKKFIYSKEDGSKSERTIFVMQENDANVAGFDFQYLDETQQRNIISLLENHIPSPIGTKGEPIEGYDPAWNKAWRCFKKANIDDATADKLDEALSDALRKVIDSSVVFSEKDVSNIVVNFKDGSTFTLDVK